MKRSLVYALALIIPAAAWPFVQSLWVWNGGRAAGWPGRWFPWAVWLLFGLILANHGKNLFLPRLGLGQLWIDRQRRLVRFEGQIKLP